MRNSKLQIPALIQTQRYVQTGTAGNNSHSVHIKHATGSMNLIMSNRNTNSTTRDALKDYLFRTALTTNERWTLNIQPCSWWRKSISDTTSFQMCRNKVDLLFAVPPKEIIFSPASGGWLVGLSLSGMTQHNQADFCQEPIKFWDRYVATLRHFASIISNFNLFNRPTGSLGVYLLRSAHGYKCNETQTVNISANPCYLPFK